MYFSRLISVPCEWMELERYSHQDGSLNSYLISFFFLLLALSDLIELLEELYSIKKNIIRTIRPIRPKVFFFIYSFIFIKT